MKRPYHIAWKIGRGNEACFWTFRIVSLVVASSSNLPIGEHSFRLGFLKGLGFWAIHSPLFCHFYIARGGRRGLAPTNIDVTQAARSCIVFSRILLAMEDANPPAAISKKAAAKAAKLAQKAMLKQASEMTLSTEEVDPLAANYGDVAMENLQSKEQSGKVWCKVGDLNVEHEGQTILVRGRVHTVRGTGKLAFLVVRESGHTVQCVISVKENVVSKGMVKFVTKINKESIVDVEGLVTVPAKPIEGTSQKVIPIWSPCLSRSSPWCQASQLSCEATI